MLLPLLLAACGGGTPAPRANPTPDPVPVFERPEGRRPQAYVAPGAVLTIPVRGTRPEQLRDSYDAPRGGGSRVHNAIDIMAPAGTPVVAAADGTILKLRTGGNGGITIYQLDPDGRTLYYYAHLQRYAAGMREGLPVWRGQVIAYVGDTGNAGAGNYHLHFSVGTLTNPRRWWESENVNPYPLLAGQAARRAGPALGGGGER
ncbi:MAG TPA: M23 family metallopeptidase [Longimicrobium sp.]|nr:M23 family metallopeptidase [Longimicrobium sp.]